MQLFYLLSHTGADNGQGKRETKYETGKFLAKGTRRAMMMMSVVPSLAAPDRNKLL